MGLMSLFRLAGAGIVIAREGALATVDTSVLPPPARALVRIARIIERRDGSTAEKLTAALNRLGPSYVKLGQFMATRPDLVGEEMANGLGSLRDEIAPFPRAEAEATVERMLGRPANEIFASFSDPVAAASIAQVHKATLAEAPAGEADDPPDDVAEDTPLAENDIESALETADSEALPPPEQSLAVKVLRPGVRDRFRRDLDTFYTAARLAERFDPEARRLRTVAVVDTLARSVAIEMDLRLEAAAMSEVGQNCADDDGFRVPKVDWANTARDVLTMEWIDGVKLSDLEGLEAAGHDLPTVARRLMQAFLRQALRDGFFHADMHQGNFFVEEDGTIVAVDFGIMGRLGPGERRFLAEILLGFIDADYLRVAQVHFRAGYVPAHHSVEDFAQAIRAIGEPIHGQSASDISMGKLLTLLFEVTGIFDMETRPELLMLQKTMMVVEGVCRSLDPAFDMWSTSEPVVRDWIERNLGPAGQIESAVEGLGAMARLAGDLPKLAERAERLSADFARMGEGGIRLDSETIEKIGRVEARHGRGGRILLGVIAVLLAVLVYIAM